MFAEVDHPGLALLMDPTNYFEAHNIDRMDPVLKQIFDTLAAKIRIAHAKDVKRAGTDKGEKHVDIDASEAHSFRGVGEIELATATRGRRRTASGGRHWNALDGLDTFCHWSRISIRSLQIWLRWYRCVSVRRTRSPLSRLMMQARGRVESEPIEIRTEDWGSVLFRFTNGARGAMCVSQVTAGRKNRITFEIACARASLAWDSEHPNDLWIGHRDKSN
jgi:hypothetical protein